MFRAGRGFTWFLSTFSFTCRSFNDKNTIYQIGFDKFEILERYSKRPIFILSSSTDGHLDNLLKPWRPCGVEGVRGCQQATAGPAQSPQCSVWPGTLSSPVTSGRHTELLDSTHHHSWSVWRPEHPDRTHQRTANLHQVTVPSEHQA